MRLGAIAWLQTHITAQGPVRGSGRRLAPQGTLCLGFEICAVGKRQIMRSIDWQGQVYLRGQGSGPARPNEWQGQVYCKGSGRQQKHRTANFISSAGKQQRSFNFFSPFKLQQLQWFLQKQKN